MWAPVHRITMSVRAAARILLACLLCSAQPARAIELNFSLKHFDRTEYDQSGVRVNRERGFLPGLRLSAARITGAITHSLSIDLHSGSTDYDGRLQSGPSLDTTTEQRMLSIHYELSAEPATALPEMFLRLGWHRWRRDIRPTAISNRLLERYNWLSLEPGVRVSSLSEDGDRLTFEVSGLITGGGDVAVDLEATGFGVPRVELGDGVGMQLAARYALRLDGDGAIEFSIMHRYLEVERGTPSLISNGSTIATITEPESQDRSSVLMLQYHSAL